MSGRSYTPQIVLHRISPLDDAHPQYQQTPRSNQAQLEDAGLDLNPSSTEVGYLTCDDGQQACPSGQMERSGFDPVSGRASHRTGSPEEGQTALGVLLDLVLKDDQIRVGGAVDAGTEKTSAPDRVTDRDFVIAASAAAEGAYDLQGSIEPRSDGRFDVTSTSTQGAGLAGTFAAKQGLGTALGGGAKASVGSTEKRICTAEEVAWARKVFRNDALAAYQLTMMRPDQLADLAVGESLEDRVDLDGSIAFSGSSGAGGLTLKGEAALGRSSRVERTQEGLRFIATKRFHERHAGGVEVGMDAVRAGGALEGGRGTTLEKTAELVLDPETQGALVEELEGVDPLFLFDRLAALPGVQISERTAQERDHDQRGGFALAAVEHHDSGTFTVDEDGLTDGTSKETDTTKLLGLDVGVDGVTQAADSDLEGITLTRANADRSVGFDGDAKFDLLSPVDTLLDFVTVEDKDPTINRRFSNDDLEALLRVAGTRRWEEAYPKGRGDTGRWIDLGANLAGVRSLPEEVRVPLMKRFIASYVANGGDLRSFEVVAQQSGIGHSEQWPASLKDGAERLAELRWRIEREPTTDDLVELDRLRNDVAAAADFTVANAKADRLTELVALRRDAVSKIAARDPAEAGDLGFEQGQVEIHAGIQRCADFRDRESGMWEGGLDSDPERRVAELQGFYRSWHEAVERLREAYRRLKIPERSWAVTPTFEAGVDGTAYQPCTGRVLEFAAPYHEHKALLSAVHQEARG